MKPAPDSGFDEQAWARCCLAGFALAFALCSALDAITGANGVALMLGLAR